MEAILGEHPRHELVGEVEDAPDPALDHEGRRQERADSSLGDDWVVHEGAFVGGVVEHDLRGGPPGVADHAFGDLRLRGQGDALDARDAGAPGGFDLEVRRAVHDQEAPLGPRRLGQDLEHPRKKSAADELAGDRP